MTDPIDLADLFDDSETLPLDQQEEESDLPRDKMGDPSEAVLFNTDWTVSTLVQQIERGNVELDPDFQRRAAWDPRRRSQLIESLIIGLPIPNVVLAEHKKGRGQFIVIDGKQRLSTLFDFVSKESPRNFKLRGLTIRTDLNGMSFDDLKKKSPNDANFFENAPIRTVVVRNWPNEYFLYVIFDRLNSGSLPLSAQELRRALIPGPFLTFVDDYLEGSEIARSALGFSSLDRRMRDSELVLRFVALEKYYPDYGGDFKAFLDRPVAYFNEDWEGRRSEAEQIFKRLDQALSVALEVFDGEPFRKWNGQAFERRMNRAIFDCITRFYAEASIADSAIVHKKETVDLLKKLLDGDSEFKRSIEQTTKTPHAMETRLSVWGGELAKILGLTYDATVFRIR
ncbi:DUF262 domain-containing protein [Brevundimonas staleyi]|uniref:DUF262 domain-containing protein n=1 Tax=Brevundimonas staleyi TaxID=74326 RepID=A0ABW0FUU8_9CAUL